MENASKALIIAGAILLAILLITLGIMVFNQASNTVTNSGMSEAELTAFNSKFVKYEGKQKGTMIKSMVQEVMAWNNSDGATEGTRIAINTPNGDLKPNINREGASTLQLQAKADASPRWGTNSGGAWHQFSNNKTFNVEIHYASNGRVGLIEVYADKN